MPAFFLSREPAAQQCPSEYCQRSQDQCSEDKTSPERKSPIAHGNQSTETQSILSRSGNSGPNHSHARLLRSPAEIAIFIRRPQYLGPGQDALRMIGDTDLKLLQTGPGRMADKYLNRLSPKRVGGFDANPGFLWGSADSQRKNPAQQKEQSTFHNLNSSPSGIWACPAGWARVKNRASSGIPKINRSKHSQGSPG